ncbi:diguanylate cyclase [Marinobacter pelagius]|uniref:sensor domain-containing diguanylate cyclase n=1 Tax=Marinobacter sp. C7 TaxID=2951363 RepID=UPI001EF0A88E|nr:sensor domain-containing diguanylate cyclase [Marinobacter sp. C7]MCG7199738.1 diguanylate cyclase [Marinobacter sp. C7]
MQLSSETRLKAILDGTGAGTWEWNLDTNDVIFNERWAGMLGYTLDELAPVTFGTWERLCHPADLDLAWKALQKYLDGKGPQFECVIRMQHKDGQWRYIHTRGMLLNGNGQPRWLMGTHLDVTEEKVTGRRLAQLAESLPGIIYTFVMEPDGRYYFTYMSRKVEDFFGLTAAEACANAELLFQHIHPDDLQAVHDSIGNSFATLQQWVCDYRVINSGMTGWLRGVAKPEREPDGKVIWQGMVINIDDEKRLELELERLSVTDELTGLFNRRYFLRKLEETATQQERYGGEFSLVSVDLDHFKEINDAYGHPVGDLVLKRFGQLIQNRVRKSDVVARTGGEEFLILMPQTSLENAAQVTDDLRSAIEAESFVSDENQAFTVTMSAGVVSCREEVVTVRELLSVCDRSLYKAKRKGRNQVMVQYPASETRA